MTRTEFINYYCATSPVVGADGTVAVGKTLASAEAMADHLILTNYLTQS
jgi:hypothetical protein